MLQLSPNEIAPADLTFLAGGGATGQRIAAFDWAATSMGPIASWPTSLRTSLSLILNSRFPTFFCWGPELLSFYNDAYRPFLGTKPEALGRPFAEVWSEAWADMGPIAQKALEGEASYFENMPITLERDGQLRDTWWTFSYSPVRKEDGSVGGVLCTVHETTSAILAERRLAAERKWLARMFDQAPGLLAMLRGPDHVFELANPGYLRLIGRRDILGKPVREALPEIAGQGYVELLDQVYRTGVPFVGTALPVQLRPTPDGPYEERFFDFVYQPLRDEDGKVTGIVAEGQEVTERARAEAKLRASEAHLSTIFEQSAAGLSEADANGRFLRVNDRFCEIAGRSREELLALRMHDITHPEDLPNNAAQFQAAAEVGKAFEVEKRYIRPDGSVVWVHNSVTRLRDLEGELDSIVCLTLDITERKLAEAERSKLLAIIEQSSDFMGIATPDGGALYVNEAGRRLVGLKDMDSARATHVRDYFAPEDLPFVEEVVLPTMMRDGRWVGEFPFRRFDTGEKIVMHYNQFTIRNDDGDVIGVAAVARDITLEKQSAEALRESEARLRDKAAEFEALAENVSQLAWMAEPDGHIFWYNRRWYEYTGTTLEEMQGWGWREVHHPEHVDRVLEEVRANWARGEAWEGTYLLRSSDGEFRPFLTRAEPIRDSDGRLVRWFGTNTDVTEQLSTQARLRENEAELQRLNALLVGEVEERTRERDRMFELSHDLFVVGDLEGRLRTFNPAWSRLLGYSDEELVGRAFIELIHPEDRGSANEMFALLKSGGVVRHFEDRIFRKDGSLVRMAWTAVPEGDLFYAVGRDITQERLRDEALRQSQKMEAVGHLTGGIAHDFNNLLGAVVGSLDLIRRKPTDVARVQRFAEAGLEAAERGARLTGQLLAFSRSQRLETKVFDLSELVSGMHELLARSLGPQVQLTMDLAPGPVPVMSDPTQLEMAVLNLAINARDAMPDGGLLAIGTRLRPLGLDAELPAGEYIELSVRDTGTGMAPEVAARAMDPFFTTKGVGKGTGLGLSQVYGIVRQGGGTVRIESQPGVGTTVRVLLPRTALPIQTVEGPSTDEPAGQALEAKILVVDDDPDVRQMLVGALESLGFAVAEAEDGSSGLALLRLERPDLLLVDFAMPGMNGADVAKAARDLRPGLPIVFVSGYSDTAAIEAVAGENARLLRKPFRVSELQAVVCSALAAMRKAKAT